MDRVPADSRKALTADDAASFTTGPPGGLPGQRAADFRGFVLERSRAGARQARFSRLASPGGGQRGEALGSLPRCDGDCSGFDRFTRPGRSGRDEGEMWWETAGGKAGRLGTAGTFLGRHGGIAT